VGYYIRAMPHHVLVVGRLFRPGFVDVVVRFDGTEDLDQLPPFSPHDLSVVDVSIDEDLKIKTHTNMEP